MQSGFFLGANSKDGFSSFYHTLSQSVEKLYIIKGCPGGGKSTFMRRVEQLVESPSERIYCSSDPDSLDAVIFPDRRIALVDGTAPHVVEPTFALAVEEYINLGVFADTSALPKERIIETTRRYKRKFSRVYRLTSCAGTLRKDLHGIALGGVDTDRITKKAKGILSRELRPTGRTGGEAKRFLSAISPSGFLTLFDTVKAYADRVYELEDSYHLAAPLFEEIARAAVGLGHRVYTCYSPLCPETPEHLILPDARLAFVTSNPSQPYPYTPTRRIRIDAMLDPEYRKRNRGKLKFTAALSKELLDAACEELAEAKRIHDELEALYHPAIRFDELLQAAERLAETIRGISH
ncbi:MAG: hypothetical protein IJC88_01025 [Oscillospiraceae bacterium]|nr:hypothetical protein [Oscillospiraceae bacterium]